jgi:hypothetical protein
MNVFAACARCARLQGITGTQAAAKSPAKRAPAQPARQPTPQQSPLQRKAAQTPGRSEAAAAARATHQRGKPAQPEGWDDEDAPGDAAGVQPHSAGQRGKSYAHEYQDGGPQDDGAHSLMP